MEPHCGQWRGSRGQRGGGSRLAGRRSHLAGRGGRLRHSGAGLLLLLLRCAAGELEGSEEADGMVPDVAARNTRLHAPHQIRSGQREHLKKKTGLTFLFCFNEGIQGEETFH